MQTIVGHGIDIVSISDTANRLKVLGKAFTDPFFTAAEMRACDAGTEQAAKLSGRLAVKEAVLKALGTGFGKGVSFTDVEIVNELSGEPKVVLHRRLKILANDRKIERWLISTSHEAGIAMASVIALGRE
jgi:holo-[acyl-carrier protein] synthase